MRGGQRGLGMGRPEGVRPLGRYGAHTRQGNVLDLTFAANVTEEARVESAWELGSDHRAVRVVVDNRPDPSASGGGPTASRTWESSKYGTGQRTHAGGITPSSQIGPGTSYGTSGRTLRTY